MHAGYFFMNLLQSADYLSKLFIQKKNLSGTISECQIVWIQIRTDVLSVLIWVQTVCKGQQQTTTVAADQKRELNSISHRKGDTL